jgi:hypothetical protein
MYNKIMEDDNSFEANYPKVSYKITKKLATYENIKIKNYKDALLLTTARILMERGSGVQTLISAKKGLQVKT